MEGDDEDDELLPPRMNDWSMERPTLKRGISGRLSAMQVQDDEDSQVDLAPDEYSDIQNCSMITTRRPRKAAALSALQEDDAEGDFIMEMHETSTEVDSPYAVEDAVAFIRGVVDDNHNI